MGRQLHGLAAFLLVAVVLPGAAWSESLKTEYLPSESEFGGDSTQFEALCLSSNELEPLAGVTLRLCPAGLDDAAEKVLRNECEIAVADEHGRVRFTRLETRDYVLRADLEGFAATTVGPLGYGDSNPQGPRRVVVLMNPVCWDC